MSDRRNHCATILVKYVAIEHSFTSAFCSDVKFDTNVKKLKKLVSCSIYGKKLSNFHKKKFGLGFYFRATSLFLSTKFHFLDRFYKPMIS